MNDARYFEIPKETVMRFPMPLDVSMMQWLKRNNAPVVEDETGMLDVQPGYTLEKWVDATTEDLVCKFERV